MSSFSSRLHFWSWTMLVLALGYVLGVLILRVERAGAPEPITVLRRESEAAVPVVRLHEIQEGVLIGSIGTGARLVIGEEVITPEEGGEFRVDATAFLVNTVDVPVPSGVLFVASSRGKNYYPLGSSAGEKIVPANRRYFGTTEEAEAAGYKCGE